MYLFDLLFPPAMILFPALMCLFWPRPADAAVDERRTQTLTRWLWLGTMAALAVFGAVWWTWGGPVARHLWVLCWLLFPLAMILLNAKNPDMVTHNTGATTRTASLVSRRAASPVPAAAWVVAWLLWAMGVAAVAVGWALSPAAAGGPGMGWMLAGGLLIGAAICPALAMWSVRLVCQEPEPLDQRGSADLAAAYARLRAFRAWGMYALFGLVMPVTLSVFAAVTVWLPMDGRLSMWLGIAGGVLGTIFGLAGAALGTMASLHRARINGLLRRREHGA
jgi:hypothetical protein